MCVRVFLAKFLHLQFLDRPAKAAKRCRDVEGEGAYVVESGRWRARNHAIRSRRKRASREGEFLRRRDG
jgi:hypothetical protein